MKIPLIKHLLLLLVTAVLLSSCKDDDEGNGGGDGTTPVTTAYLPGTTGSIWVYSNQSISSDGTITDIAAQDTLTITKENSTVLARTANEVAHNFIYPFGGGVQNTANYAVAQDGSKLSVSSNFMNLLIPDPVQEWINITPDSWLLMANGNAGAGAAWTIDSTHFADYVVEGLPIPLTLKSGDVKFAISRQKDTTVDNKPCHHYKLSIYYLGTLLLPSLPDLVQTALNSIGNVQLVLTEINFFWVPELGLQKLTAPAQQAYVKPLKAYPPLIPEGWTYPIDGFTMPGFAKTLVYNKINK